MTKTGNLRSEPRYSQKDFSESPSYLLNRNVTLEDNSQKRIELIPSISDLTVRRYHLLTVNTGGQPETGLRAESRIEFSNSKDNKLGVPLPKGRVQVFKNDSLGSLQFIGEDAIEHTPQGQSVRLKMGRSALITANKVVNAYASTEKGYKASLSLTVSNERDTEAEIVIDFNKAANSSLKISWEELRERQEVVSPYLWRVRKSLPARSTFAFSWEEEAN